MLLIWQSLGGTKRKRESERDEEKQREVIHVRAKRGQATDSHSLAERVSFQLNFFAHQNGFFWGQNSQVLKLIE